MYSNFFIIGNGGGGTSLLRGFLHSHSKCQVKFEQWNTIDNWLLEAKELNNKGFIFGNKLPVEQFETQQKENDFVLDIVKHFRIIWIQRRYSKYAHGQPHLDHYKKHWERSRVMFWLAKEEKPSCVIKVSFEDLLLWTKAELYRLCAFLDIDYEEDMLENGPTHTGHNQYSYSGVLLNKV